jgi:hypothetical protein
LSIESGDSQECTEKASEPQAECPQMERQRPERSAVTVGGKSGVSRSQTLWALQVGIKVEA